jgi:hypothetical protein
MDQELVEYLDSRFNAQEQRLDERFQGMEQRFGGLEQRFQNLLDDRINEVKRHTGVLVEGLRHEVHLLAEGLAMHIQVQHATEREYFDRKFEDTQVLIRTSYDHLRQQRQ